MNMSLRANALLASSRSRMRITASLAAGAVFGLASWGAGAEVNRVTFPKNLEGLVHYTTVTRGPSTERMLTSQAVIDAVKAGKDIPAGAHVVLADFREGKVFRYFVMEKGPNWGAEYDERRRTGDWQFQSFKPDRSVNMAENTARCQSCHQPQGSKNDFMYTFDALRAAK
jgi:hypothetical protein